MADNQVRFALEGKEFIPLIHLLKAVRLADSGGMAQCMVEEGLVTRNGEVELRKRAKIRAGERIEFEGISIDIVP